MPTLLITLDGPLQSWGASSKFSYRATEPAPTKSGVLGLVAAAQGIRRTEPLTELIGLRFGVRSDQPGQIMRDFQTARSRDGKEQMPLSHRFYLSDAVFLAALEHTEIEVLHAIQHHLAHPTFPLYLGRRACPPTGPIATEIVQHGIEAAFAAASWRAKPFWRAQYRDDPQVALETRIDHVAGANSHGTVVTAKDTPVSFNPERRVYAWREVVLSQVLVNNPDFGQGPTVEKRSVSPQASAEDHHDAFEDWPEGAK